MKTFYFILAHIIIFMVFFSIYNYINHRDSPVSPANTSEILLNCVTTHVPFSPNGIPSDTVEKQIIIFIHGGLVYLTGLIFLK